MYVPRFEFHTNHSTDAAEWNKLGAEGWQLVSTLEAKNGVFFAFFTREVPRPAKVHR